MGSKGSPVGLRRPRDLTSRSRRSSALRIRRVLAGSGLALLGCYGAAQSLLILDPKTCRPQYHMIHASDHPRAFEFMRWAERKSSPYAGEKLALPGMEQHGGSGRAPRKA